MTDTTDRTTVTLDQRERQDRREDAEREDARPTGTGQAESRGQTANKPEHQLFRKAPTVKT